MPKKETHEEIIARLSEEYRFAENAPGDTCRKSPKISVSYDGIWCVRMENSERMLGHFVRQNGVCIDACSQGNTLSEALKKLESLCRNQVKLGAVLLDPAKLASGKKKIPRVTLNDIAEKVGCSRAAVSFAILGNHPVSSELKMRIFAELERSNYKPSPGRKSVPRKTVVILQRFYEGESGDLGHTVSQFIMRGYNPVICYLPLYNPLDEVGMAAFAQIREMPNIAGILSVHPTLESMDILRYSGDLPVTINCRPDSMLSNIFFDFSAVGELVASLGRKFKHKKLAFVSYGEFDGREYQLLSEGLKRKNSGRNSIRFIDVPVPAGLCNLPEIMPELDKAFAEECTFFFAQSEEHCALIKHWAEIRNISIPGELSLLYMDYDRIAEEFRPEASSILIPFRKILDLVVEEMVCKIEHKPVEKQVFLPELNDRGSIGRANIIRKSSRETGAAKEKKTK